MYSMRISFLKFSFSILEKINYLNNNIITVRTVNDGL